MGDPLPMGTKLLYKSIKESLKSNIKLTSIYSKEDAQNDYDNPLIIKVGSQEEGKRSIDGD